MVYLKVNMFYQIHYILWDIFKSATGLRECHYCFFGLLSSNIALNLGQFQGTLFILYVWLK